jgi:hypothetical protein
VGGFYSTSERTCLDCEVIYKLEGGDPGYNGNPNSSETIARPSFRELAAYRGYDPTTDEIAEGNPNLKSVRLGWV